MGTSISDLYRKTRGASEPKNGVNYNRAHSKKVRRVDAVEYTENHSIPITYKPYTVIRKIRNGKVIKERYYDKNGNAYLDIDYTDHGNPKLHNNPHQHQLRVKGGKLEHGNKEEII